MPWLDWISLFVRWFHVVAGVAWIGASFYFIWLDNNLREPPAWKKQKGIKGDLWAVHGGGFYEVAKYAYGPEQLPEKLHWFKWEAYSTWLSGIALLILVYYLGASAYLIDPAVKAMSPTMAVGLGIGFIAGGFVMYELACRSPLGNKALFFAICLAAFIAFMCWLSTQWFSGRGAYIHVGALVGTIMVANVFLVIMPSQRKMVNAVSNGLDIDPKWGAGAKLRSVHNNYFTLPLLFIMISNHYPQTYQHEMNWLVLVLIMAISAWIRHFFNLKHQGQHKPGILVSGAAAMALLAVWASWPQAVPQQQAAYTSTTNTMHDGQALSEQELAVQMLIGKHCVSCHAASPTDDVFKVAPLGVKLDSWGAISRYKASIINRTTVTKDMPFLNKTNMTQAERQLLADWGTTSGTAN